MHEYVLLINIYKLVIVERLPSRVVDSKTAAWLAHHALFTIPLSNTVLNLSVVILIKL